MRKLLTWLALAAAWAMPAGAATRAAMTIYSHDLAFVREQRTLNRGGAGDTVRMGDLPDRLDVSSVRLTLPGNGRVSRLAYRFDVASGDRILEVARGQRVVVMLRENRVIEGTLVGADGGWLMVREDGGALETVARSAIEHVRFARPPASLAVEPTLEAVLSGVSGSRVPAELSYLTGGLSWSAEHTLVRDGESAGTWGSMISIENVSGQDFDVPRLGLVAGEPHRDRPMPPPMIGRVMESSVAAQKFGDGADVSEQGFSEYHLYTLDRRALLRDRETQRLVMLEDRAVRLTPRYVVRGGMNTVATQLELVNTTANGLGLPLPDGRVRVYEKDTQGELRFTGESHIRHTPEGEKLTIDVGNAFDLVAERREVYNKRISDHEREYEVEIKLRNRKKTNVTIVVEENVASDNEVIRKSHDYTRKDANTLVFQVPVAAGKEAVLDYVVRVRF
jgi:hypothetical protein